MADFTQGRGPLGGGAPPGGNVTLPKTVLLQLLQAVGGTLVVTQEDFENPSDFEIHAEWSHSSKYGIRYDIELIVPNKVSNKAEDYIEL